MPRKSLNTTVQAAVAAGLLPAGTTVDESIERPWRVVLLTAVALHRVAFGLALLVAFSLGLASVLTAIGLGIAYAHRRVSRDLRAPRLLLLAPVVSSVLVLSLGALLVARALAR